MPARRSAAVALLGPAPARHGDARHRAARHPPAAVVHARLRPATDGGAHLRRRLVRPERPARPPRRAGLRTSLHPLRRRVAAAGRGGLGPLPAPARRRGPAAAGPDAAAGRGVRRAGAAVGAAQPGRRGARRAVARRRHAAVAGALRRRALVRGAARPRVHAPGRSVDPQPLAQGKPARAHQPRLLPRRGRHDAGHHRRHRPRLRRAPGVVRQPPADGRVAARRPLPVADGRMARTW